MEPSEPVTPVEPVTPAAPVEPVTPVVPTPPVTPVVPDPVTKPPVEPAAPAEPVKPVVPVTPKPGEQKTADSTEFDLKLPPDSNDNDKKIMEDVKAFAKANNIGQDHAQKILERNILIRGKVQEDYYNGIMEEHKKLTDSWVAEVKADKVIGGENYNKCDQMAEKLCAKFGGEEVVKILKDNKYWDNPAVKRFMVNIQRQFEPDKFVVTDGQVAPNVKSNKEVFYGDTKYPDKASP